MTNWFSTVPVWFSTAGDNSSAKAKNLTKTSCWWISTAPRPSRANHCRTKEKFSRRWCWGCAITPTSAVLTALLGLSGGIDSALTAVIAVAALGKENVRGVSLPSQFSSTGSLDDARILAQSLGVQYDVIPIQPMFLTAKEQLKSVFAGRPEDIAEENIQARLRGVILMGMSNKFDSLLLTTGNKSETAVGYCTLYGDMCGGLSVINDVPKMMVYRLSNWINREREIIPAASITKPPSAELRHDQTDQNSLPPYEVLDAILSAYVVQGCSVEEIIQSGFDAQTIRRVVRLIEFSEYKRRQAAPGLKVTTKAFGMGRRVPVSHRYREY